MLFYTLATDNFVDQILDYVDQGLSFVADQAGWLQLVIYACAALFVLIGFFVFIKKFIKVFIVLAVLAGGVYYLWTQTSVLDSVKDLINLSAFISSTLFL